MKHFVGFFLLLGALLHAQSIPQQHFGSAKYVEYIAGDLPLILCSPHGGALKPKELPDRTRGVTGADANTQELTRLIMEQLVVRYGRRPHCIMSHLHRSKLDPNREISEAAQGHAAAAQSWGEYHALIEKARDTAIARHGYAFLIDMHGQNHKGERIELGYLHSPGELSQDAATINAAAFSSKSSIAMLLQRSGRSYTELLHGPQSMGALLAARGWRCTPSPQMPVPDEPYFKGGYTVARHCTGQTTGFQLEANRTRLRDTTVNRERFVNDFIPVLAVYLKTHLGLDLGPASTLKKP
ncbi:MAG: hypothetical protein IPK32_15825 [Verrucomicrobiaceae bacterium]|nr:hypothetical protein [Verrucomicrobiaceae bacterium]